MEQLTREFIAESRDGLDRMEQCLTELENQPDNRESISEIFRVVHTIKGTTGFLGLDRLRSLAHAGEGLLAALRDRETEVTPERINALLALLDKLREIVQQIESTGTDEDRSPGRPRDRDSDLIARLSQLKAAANQPLQGEDADQGTPANTANAAEPCNGAPLPVDRQTPTASPPTALPQRTIRIDVEVLNRMMNQVGELVLTRNQLLRSSPAAENFTELTRRLDSVTAELRESVMQARMQPVGRLYSKFPRMVRDLARECGRKVRIEFAGQDTELDKGLLEVVRDPLTHAVRNALDHGIEPPEERVKAGKPAEGVVRLCAFHQSGSVVVEVVDDGAGISTERVLAKAIERGFVTEARAAAMSAREALQLIFLAGFSTAKEVTDVSGRGVGMDVVRSNLAKAGGSVEVESQPGLGTTVRLRVPLTLAIVPALVVQSGGQSFALPQTSLTELVYLEPGSPATHWQRVGTAELYRLRGDLLPLVRLDRLLGLTRSDDVGPRGCYLAVLESAGRRFALIVDDLSASEEIVAKPLSSVLVQIGMYSGATLLGNGTLALILDVAAIGAAAGLRAAPEPTAPTVSHGPEHEKERPGGAMIVYEPPGGVTSKAAPAAPMALPLNVVERIERVPLSRIEYADARPVLQYDGELLPLLDEHDVLSQAATETATIMICRQGNGPERVGMVANGELRIETGTALAPDPRLHDAQLVMVSGRVATVPRECSAAPLAEVA